MEVFSLIPMKGLRASEVAELNLRYKGLGPAEAQVIGSLAGVSASLTSLDVGGNNIGKEAALALVSIFKEKDQMQSVSLAGCDLGVDEAKAVADYVSVSGSLTKLDVRYNTGIEGGAAEQLAAAVLANVTIEVFNEIPIKELRANSLTELDLSRSNDSRLLGSIVGSATGLTDELACPLVLRVAVA